MATPGPPIWKWDEGRKQYYWHSQSENCYVYENGSKLNYDGTAVDDIPRTAGSSRDIRTETRQGSDVSKSEYSYTVTKPLIGASASSPGAVPGFSTPATSSAQTSSATPTAAPQGQNENAGGNYGTYTYASTDSIRSLAQGYPTAQYTAGTPTSPISTSSYRPAYSTYQTRQGHNAYPATASYSPMQQASSQNTTGQPNDGSSQSEPKSKWIRATTGRQEPLNKNYRVREPGSAFFRRGIVFKVLWSEPAGARHSQKSTWATEHEEVKVRSDGRFVEGTYGQTIYTEFRWFVVIREGTNCCTCLRIQTFKKQGVSRNKVKKEHAIIYTGTVIPPLQAEEIPRPGEEPMGAPIRVIANRPGDKMDPLSRINFLKPYTVEHNVKVYDFGRVDPDDDWKLVRQWKKAWGIPEPTVSSGATAQPQTPASVPSMTADLQNMSLQYSLIPGGGYGGYGRSLNPSAPDFRTVPQEPASTRSTGSDQYGALAVSSGGGYITAPGNSALDGTTRTASSEYHTGSDNYRTSVVPGRGYSSNLGYSAPAGATRTSSSASTASYDRYPSSTVPSEYDRPRRSSHSTTTASGDSDYCRSRPPLSSGGYGHEGSVYSESTGTVTSGEETEVPDDDELYEAPKPQGRRRRRR